MRIGAKDTAERESAFEALLAPVLSAAYGAALHMTRNAADAEDLVQEAALLALRGFGTFEQGTNFKAWFFRILTNCFYSKHRKEKRQPSTIDLADAPDLYLYSRSVAEGLPHRGPDPASQLLERLGTEQVTTAIQQLPEEYRVVSSLYFMQDFTYQEIARVLSCPVGTVRSRLHRGRKMLQKALWQLAMDQGIVSELSGTGGLE